MDYQVNQNDFIQKLRNKPEKVKQRIFYGTFVAVAILLFGGWLLFINFSEDVEKPPLFSGLAEQIQILGDTLDQSGKAINESTSTYKQIRKEGKAQVITD